MIRTSLFLAASAFCLAPAAQADHDHYGGYHAPQPTVSTAPCERQKKNDQVAGALVGAVAGGLIGVAIGGELGPMWFEKFEVDNERDAWSISELERLLSKLIG